MPNQYYVYQCDLVKGNEDLRTPLSVILDLEQQLRGTIAGFMMPSFVVDLPGGGGKRLAAACESYDPKTGISKFKAPGLGGEKGEKIYHYYDPAPSQKRVQHTPVLQASDEDKPTMPRAVAGGRVNACYPNLAHVQPVTRDQVVGAHA